MRVVCERASAVVILEFENPFGYEDSLVVELMRSTEWLQANNVDLGRTVRLAFEELKVDDDGYVSRERLRT